MRIAEQILKIIINIGLHVYLHTGGSTASTKVLNDVYTKRTRFFIQNALTFTLNKILEIPVEELFNRPYK